MRKNIKETNVAVILGFFNGNKYISSQIKSILNQSHRNIDIYIFDDNSSKPISFKGLDLTLEDKKKLHIIKRTKNMGYAKNFLIGLKDVKKEYEFYSFSDQDDIWEKDKILRALTLANSIKNNKPILYFSRTAYYSEDCLNQIGYSRLYKKNPSFSNSLLQNIAGGNTIMINQAARKIIIKTITNSEFISHDWWCYQIISGVGGEIIYDKALTVKYRQHNSNLIGKNIGLSSSKQRLIEFSLGKVKRWLDLNIKNLTEYKHLLNNENLEILTNFSKARNSRNIFKKLKYYFKSGVFRQSRFENLIFIFGFIINKV